MNRFGAIFGRYALGAQIALAGAALALAALWPPATGRMILLPLLPETEMPILVRAVNGGALVLGAGPLPHSHVVSGRRAAIASALRGSAVLILAAPPVLCGSIGAIGE